MTITAETTEMPQEEMERAQGGGATNNQGRLLVGVDDGVWRGDETIDYVLMGTPPGN